VEPDADLAHSHAVASAIEDAIVRDLPGSDATAARAVNAISTVCQAPLASAARSTSSSSRPE